MTESKQSNSSSANWRTVSVFLGIAVLVVTVVNFTQDDTSAHDSFVTTLEYQSHAKWADERYTMMCGRLDDISAVQKEILRELRNAKKCP